jgi:hypothetical protein
MYALSYFIHIFMSGLQLQVHVHPDVFLAHINTPFFYLIFLFPCPTQAMLSNIQTRIFCLLVCYLKILKLEYTKL